MLMTSSLFKILLCDSVIALYVFEYLLDMYYDMFQDENWFLYSDFSVNGFDKTKRIVQQNDSTSRQ